MSLRFWLRAIGPKWLTILTSLVTVGVIIAGCHETYG